MVSNKHFLSLFLTLLCSLLCGEARAQLIAIENNIVWDAAASINMGGQIAPSQRNSFGLYGSMRPGRGDAEKMIRFWTLEAEYRRWTCRKFDGLYFGPYVHGGMFNIANKQLIGLFKGLKGTRYEGWFYGGGMAVGYHLPITTRFNLGFEIGAGYDYLRHDEFACLTCAKVRDHGDSNYWGVNKAGLNLVYVLPRHDQKSALAAIGALDATIPDITQHEEHSTRRHPSVAITVDSASLGIVGGEMICNIVVTVDENIRSTQGSLLYPILTSHDGEHVKVFPAFFINGRRQHIYYNRERKARHYNSMGVRKHKDEELKTSYTRSIPFEPWMEDATLTLQRNSCGCTVTRPDGEEQLAIIEPESARRVRLTPALDLPNAEAPKIGSTSGQAFLCFERDKTEIKPNYLTNPQELAKITAAIDTVAADSDLKIQLITIEGYASPSWKEDHNLWLSNERMKSLKAYIEQMPNHEDYLIESAGMGENWIGFYEMLDTLQHMPQYELIREIAYCDTLSNDAKEEQMRKRAPRGWSYLYNECFQYLRCTNFTIEYEVKPYSVEEAEKVFQHHPERLSLNEIYLIASKHEEDPEQVKAILQKAYLFHPDDHYTNMVMACLALKSRLADEAEGYLNKTHDCPVKTMNMAILTYLRGDKDKAIELMQQAADAGLEAAVPELEKLKKLRH